jgi:hypothetical protein
MYRPNLKGWNTFSTEKSIYFNLAARVHEEMSITYACADTPNFINNIPPIEAFCTPYPIMKLTYHLPSIVLIVSVLTALARGVEDELLRQDYTRRSTRNVQLPLPDGDTAVPRGKLLFVCC